MGDPAPHCSQSALATPHPPSSARVPRKGTRRGVKGEAGFAGQGEELCCFLKVGLHAGIMQPPPLPSPAWLLPVFGDFSALCLSFPFALLLQPLPIALGAAE